MSADQNLQLASQYFNEVWNQGNLAIIDELAPELANKGIKEFVQAQRTALGNFHVTILELFGANDRVIVHWQVNADHQGAYWGSAATGKPVLFRGLSVLRIADGKIVDDFGYWDELTILKQIGATSIPQQDSR